MPTLFPCISNGGTLPDKPDTSGYSEEYADPVIRNEMDSGPEKQRLKYTAIPLNISCQMNLSSAQKTTLLNFWKNTISYGSESFEWLNWDDDSSANYRFTAPPKVVTVTGDLWTMSLTLQRLP